MIFLRYLEDVWVLFETDCLELYLFLHQIPYLTFIDLFWIIPVFPSIFCFTFLSFLQLFFDFLSHLRSECVQKVSFSFQKMYFSLFKPLILFDELLEYVSYEIFSGCEDI